MSDLLETLKDKYTQVKKASIPRKVNPRLAKLTREQFSDKDWIFERKVDDV